MPRQGAPQIPLALRQKLAEQDEVNEGRKEERMVSASIGKISKTSRKDERKRQRSEKKVRRAAFHGQAPVAIKPLRATKQAKRSDQPAKSQKVAIVPAKRVSASLSRVVEPPQLSREDEEIAFYEKKLRRFPIKHSEFEGTRYHASTLQEKD